MLNLKSTGQNPYKYRIKLFDDSKPKLDFQVDLFYELGSQTGNKLKFLNR